MRGDAVKVETNLPDFNATLARYSELSRKTPEEVVLRQGAKLGFVLARRMRVFAPAKGAITAERLGKFDEYSGILIRPSVRRRITERYGAAVRLSDRKTVFGRTGLERQKVRGRELSIRELMVNAELSARERARGFVSVSTRFQEIRALRKANPTGNSRSATERSLGRFRTLLSESGIAVSSGDAVLELSAVGRMKDGTNAGKFWGSSRAKSATAAALAEVRSDMLVYINRKLDENKRKAGIK